MLNRTDSESGTIVGGKSKVILGKAKTWGKLVLLCFCPAIILKIRQRFRVYEKLIIRDLKSPVKVPLLKRLWAWKHGYPSKCIPLYGLNSNNAHRYLPDALYETAHPINGQFTSLIDSKLALFFTLGEFREHLPAYYLLLNRDEIINLGPHSRPVPREEIGIILDLCRKKGNLAMKRVAGTFGAGFYKLSFSNGCFQLNGVQIAGPQLSNICRNLDNYLITEYVQQHQYARQFYPNTTNTLRIMTARNYDMHESFVIRVLQKMGTSKSASPADQVALGGIACEVNIESGEIGPAVTFSQDTQQPIWYDRHPDTGTQIAGTLIPNWKEIRSKVLAIADHLAMVPYMGWDVVVTEEGFKVLELNSLPGIELVQFFRPLLDEEKTRRFYELHVPLLRNCV
jgi:hypothetical protein